MRKGIIFFILSLVLMTIVSCDNETKVINVLINPSEAIMEISDQLQLTAIISPEDATNKLLIWESSDTLKVKVDENGLVNALSEGNAIITVKTDDGGFKSTCNITVKPLFEEGDYYDEYGVNHGKGVQIADVTWAPVNCGYHAENFKYGKLYQWGRTDGLAYYNENDVNLNDNSVKPIISESALPYAEVPDKNTFYPGNFAETLGHWMSLSEDRVPAFNETTTWNFVDTMSVHIENPGVGNPCPEGWKVPTIEQFESLKLDAESLADACRFDKENKGVWFGKNRETASMENSKECLFLYAAGGMNRQGFIIDERGVTGEYWAATPDYEMAFNLTFLPGSESIMLNFSYQRAFALTVRCVR